MKKLLILMLLAAFVTFEGLQAQVCTLDGPHGKKSSKGKGMHSSGSKSQRGFGSGGMWWQSPKIAEALKLTDDQKEKLKKMHTENAEKLIDLGAQLKKTELKMQAALDDNDPDEAKVKQYVKEINEAKGQIFEKMVLTRIRVMKILTAEQKEKLKGLKSEMRKKYSRPKGKSGHKKSGGPRKK